MNLVVDASVAVKWVVPEEQEAAAEALLFSGAQWIAPEFLLVEVGNVLRTKMRNQQLELSQSRTGLDFIAATVVRFVSDGDLARRAFEIAVDMNHSIYDCLYLACAEREKVQMVTADRRFAGKLNGSPYMRRVQMLTS